MSKVTAKYQITIPPEIRKKLGILPGMEVAITQKGETFELVVDPIAALKKKWRGKLKSGISSDQYLDEVRGSI